MSPTSCQTAPPRDWDCNCSADAQPGSTALQLARANQAPPGTTLRGSQLSRLLFHALAYHGVARPASSRETSPSGGRIFADSRASAQPTAPICVSPRGARDYVRQQLAFAPNRMPRPTAPVLSDPSIRYRPDELLWWHTSACGRHATEMVASCNAALATCSFRGRSG